MSATLKKTLAVVLSLAIVYPTTQLRAGEYDSKLTDDEADAAGQALLIGGGLLLLGILMDSSSSGGSEHSGYRSSSPGAYVQSKGYRRIYNDYNEIQAYRFTARVKITRTGSYKVTAGFWNARKDKFASGLYGQYYDTRWISGDAGDVVPVTITVRNLPSVFAGNLEYNATVE